jgi:uncharacterized protein DUF6297
MTTGTDEDEVRPLAVPSPRSIRRYTRAAANRHGDTTIGALLSDVYSAILMAAIGLGTAIGVATTLRDSLPKVPARPHEGLLLPLPTLAALVVLALAGTALSLAARLGPVGVGAAEARWWLSLPVRRRGLLRPSAWRLPATAALVGGPVILVLVLFAQEGMTGSAAVRTLVGGVLGAGAIVVLAGVAQTVGVDRRVTARVGDVLLGLVPVLGLAAALGARDLNVGLTPSVAVLVALVLVAAAGGVLLDGRLERIPVRDLRDSGSVATQAAGAVVSLDSRELGRALADRMTNVRRRRSLRFGWVSSPVRALLTADLVLWWRSPRHVVQIVAAAAVPALVAAVSRLDTPFALASAYLIAGYVAMLATAEGARRAEMAPIIDRLLPLGAREVRRLRLVVPGVLMGVWTLAVLGPIGFADGDPAGWLTLALAATPVWAGAAIRSAYRPSPDWSGPLAATPMGAMPTGVGSVLVRGPDVVLLGMVPVLISIGIGRVTQTLIVVQIVCAFIAVAVGSRLKGFSLMDLAGEDPRATGATSGTSTGGKGGTSTGAKTRTTTAATAGATSGTKASGTKTSGTKAGGAKSGGAKSGGTKAGR